KIPAGRHDNRHCGRGQMAISWLQILLPHIRWLKHVGVGIDIPATLVHTRFLSRSCHSCAVVCPVLPGITAVFEGSQTVNHLRTAALSFLCQPPFSSWGIGSVTWDSQAELV